MLPSGGDHAATTVVCYFDPATEHTVERPVGTADDVLLMVSTARDRRGSRGAPAVEVRRPDGSSLSAAFDGGRAALVWVDSMGEPFHSVGGRDGPSLTFDYFGSWSEAPAENCVPSSSATDCLVGFALHGGLSDDLMFEPG